MRKFRQAWRLWLVPLLISGTYLVTHLWALTILPVFADEAIYIRWAQLILDDPLRYWFFALNDGKTPLFIWLLAGFQYVASDQLLSGRLLAVLIGLAQVWASGYLVKVLGGKSRAQWLVMGMTAVLPFWFFHHRMALIDGLLCLTLTSYVTALIKVVDQPLAVQKVSYKNILSRWRWIVVAGIALGLSFWTKIPAVLLLPASGLFSLYPIRRQWWLRLNDMVAVGVAIGIGLFMFALLRISPAFGQLFSRGSDFLFSWSEVAAGRWRETLPSIPTYVDYFWQYAQPVTVLLFVASLFSKRKARVHHLLFWSAILFALPIAIMGRVVYARYLLPVMIFMTVGAWMYWEELFSDLAEKANSLNTKAVAGIVLALLLANTIGASILFMYRAWSNPNQLPLVKSDQAQYLTEWSSGHGIVEARDFILEQAQGSSVAVATEGFFGTLPDGLMLYFHRQNHDNVYIEGIGQPVRSIPEFFTDRAQPFQKKFLVVNSHRMLMTLDRSRLLKAYCRPFKAPCLQIWDISNL